MEVQKNGNIRIVKTFSNLYVFNKKSKALIVTKRYDNFEHLMQIVTELDNYVRRKMPIIVQNTWGEYKFKIDNSFIKEYNGYEFYNISTKYVALIDGVHVETVNFKTFIVRLGKLSLGTNSFKEILNNIDNLKKLNVENLHTIKPYFTVKLSAKTLVKRKNYKVKTRITLNGDKVTMKQYATEHGIYDVTVPVNELRKAIENPEPYATKTYIRIRARNIKKISSPDYKPGYTLYSACGKTFYVSNDGDHVILHGKEFTIENGEVDLCNLRK